MIRPAILNDGTNNWAEVDWEDVDVGEYTNLCPDKRRSDFEYGSILIVNEAERGPVQKMFEPQNLSPRQVTQKLKQVINSLDGLPPDTRWHLNRLSMKQVINSLDGLPPDTRWHLNRLSRFTEPVEAIMNFLQRGIDQPPADKTKRPDEARHILADDAWAIWAKHGGDVKSKEFIQYVERLLDNAGFLSETGKSRVNVDNLVQQIRQAAKQNSPAPWRLWD